MKTVKLYYKGTFDAAHYLPAYPGNCKKLHGHTWKVEVWLKGCVDEVTGMVLDFRYIQRVIDDFDHSLLNEILALPTAENVAKRLQRDLPLAYRIRVWESDHSYAEVEKDALQTYHNTIKSLTPAERKRLSEGSWVE